MNPETGMNHTGFPSEENFRRQTVHFTVEAAQYANFRCTDIIMQESNYLQENKNSIVI